MTLNMRFAFESLDDVETIQQLPPQLRTVLTPMRPCYTAEEFYGDLLEVTRGQCDPTLGRYLAEQSWATLRWLAGLGHKWVPTSTPHAACIPLDLQDGGHGLQAHSFEIAEAVGVHFMYDAPATSLWRSRGGWTVRLQVGDESQVIESRTVIFACGGFEANREMRQEFLGDRWKDVRIRGVPFNTGDGLAMALNVGAVRYGSWDTCHASPQDAGLAPSTLPQAYSHSRKQWRYSFPFGITVNKGGRRFFDEGATYLSLMYASVGKAILAQPESIAFQIFDAQARRLGLINDLWYNEATSYQASTLADLARLAGINSRPFLDTVRRYNASIPDGQLFDPHALDGSHTARLSIPKSNWALTIKQPPYEAYPVVCGLTFTFGGIKVDTRAAVLDGGDRPIPGLFAAGEMIGGLFYHNYPGGAGMMSGAVFGRTAGASAALYAGTLS